MPESVALLVGPQLQELGEGSSGGHCWLTCFPTFRSRPPAASGKSEENRYLPEDAKCAEIHELWLKSVEEPWMLD